MNIKGKSTIGLILIICSLSFLEVTQAQTVIEVLSNNEQTTAFAQALEEANLDEKLNNSGPFTIFAPTNLAFKGLPNWQQAESSLLLNHIFTGLATSRSLNVMNNISVLSGKTVTISGEADNLRVGPHEIISTNIRAENGIIHIINGVIR